MTKRELELARELAAHPEHTKRERGIALNEKEEIIGTGVGTFDEVVIEDMDYLASKVMIHSHTRRGSLSSKDINTAIDNELEKIIAVHKDRAYVASDFKFFDTNHRLIEHGVTPDEVVDNIKVKLARRLGLISKLLSRDKQIIEARELYEKASSDIQIRLDHIFMRNLSKIGFFSYRVLKI